MNHRLLIAGAALGCLSVLELAVGGPHIFYDDAGSINWKPTFAAAAIAAQRSGRPILVHLSKKQDKASEDQVNTLLRDPRVSYLINHYMMPVSADYDKPPPELRTFLANNAPAKRGAPVMLILSPRGDKLFNTLTGAWSPKTFEQTFLETMEDKKLTVPKAREADLTKQIDAMDKALGQKAWSRAASIFKSIQAVPGYSPVKDRAYDVMDKAQADGLQDTKDAYNHVRQDEYADAKKSLDKVVKGYPGLPIADEAREHLAVVKIMEQADLYTKASKKAEAIKQFDLVLNKHSDTPYAALAKLRKSELAPAKAK